MKQISALGDVCPLPVVKAKKALLEMNKGDMLVILVDNEIAVENLKRLASSQKSGFDVVKQSEKVFRVAITRGEPLKEQAENFAQASVPTNGTVVVIASNKMGEGDDKLGAILMKSFVFALTQFEELPCAILLYNSGVFLSTGDSEYLEDLKKMEACGTEVLTCGMCLSFYGLEKELAVGGVTNMYSIVEKMATARKVIRP
ncbi:sulfurtransferase-like selenium metabolism protein YedF [Eubacteriales bacterium OttesenSCG-928-K08]|nr:sulfurtransferase-like selenium metabolism protein YedF [Eubacteriales bacterium OttesenSCG-928-K08]